MIKIFKMNDCDWVAAANLEDAKKALFETVCGATDDVNDYIEDPHVVDDEELMRLKFQDEDSSKEVQTFKEHLDELIKNGQEFPVFFASSEF